MGICGNKMEPSCYALQIAAVWVQVAFSSFTNVGPVMAIAIAVHNIPEVPLLISFVWVHLPRPACILMLTAQAVHHQVSPHGVRASVTTPVGTCNSHAHLLPDAGACNMQVRRDCAQRDVPDAHTKHHV